MNPWLRFVWIAIGVASFAAVGALFLLPADWQIERSVVIAAPPEGIYPYLEDLEGWRQWSPWQEGDYEGLEFVYSEVTRGVGAEQRWDSEATGDGSITIVSSDPPREVGFEMRFQEGTIVARDSILLSPRPDGTTQVRWAESGTVGSTLLGRLSVPVIEESMGRDLANGLARLKALCEGDEEPVVESAPKAPAGV